MPNYDDIMFFIDDVVVVVELPLTISLMVVVGVVNVFIIVDKDQLRSGSSSTFNIVSRLSAVVIIIG